MGARVYINTRHGQQLGQPLSRSLPYTVRVNGSITGHESRSQFTRRLSKGYRCFRGPLCKIPTSSLFGHLGRVLIWARRDDDAIITLQQVATICDGCGVDLNSTIERFVCRSGKDFDLCRFCYERYGGKS